MKQIKLQWTGAIIRNEEQEYDDEEKRAIREGRSSMRSARGLRISRS